MNHDSFGGKLFVPGFTALALFLAHQTLSAQNAFRETDLVSDIPGRATFTDPNLINPWGISASPTGPFWVSDAGSGRSTLYNTAGAPQALIVTVPNPSGGLASPTGQVFNGGAAFNADRFIFATEEGTIAGWRGTLGTVSETLVDNSSLGSIYKGLAIGNVGTGTYLYAADFHNGRVDVVSSSGASGLTGTFLDPGIPQGFAPFNIQNLGGQLYVTYAKQDAQGVDDLAGLGNGYVDVFSLNGDFLRRLVSNGELNSPWGLALAPAGFGAFGGNLLVGNFGDGRINAYDAVTGNFIDTLRDTTGNPLEIEGLWGLTFGNGGAGGARDTLYFAAGISGGERIEAHGLFGALNAVPVPEPGTYAAGFALMGLSGAAWFRRRRQAA